MRKIIYSLAVLGIMSACKTQQVIEPGEDRQIVVSLDLINVEEDKVMVTVDPGKFTDSNTTFYIPKTVPGTYSVDNYGKFIEDLKAFDYNGKELLVSQTDNNTWVFNNAIQLDKITYWVNDSFDVEGEEGIFSPAGTNILENENFMLNLHGFVGYFKDHEELPYKLKIHRPSNLIAGTSLPLTGTTIHPENSTSRTDTFNSNRYFGIIDNPIMYAAPDTTHINIQDMKVLIHVYSPNNVYTSKSIKPEIEKMINAQKRFLGEIDNTSNYAILLYLSNPEEIDAQGYGALEHHTSTVVVLPEMMPIDDLNKTMTDVVSHEFFHILTPLNIHSKEIHYFDYNNPEMSQHLWLYEGVTEYFAHLFQVNQDLITEQEFYDRMSSKIEDSKNYNDTVPFTLMSQKILEEPYKDDYYNVYLKGALIGMALDLKLREMSRGEKGILTLMKDLSAKYGKDKPFEDDDLIPQIVEMTYPEIDGFFREYITGEKPIPYEKFLEAVGVEMAETTIPTSYFIKGKIPYIDAMPLSGELFFRKNISLNSFWIGLGVNNGDIIKSINGNTYNVQNVYELVMDSEGWEEGEDLILIVERDGKVIELKGEISKPTDNELKLRAMNLPENDPRVKLRNEWLKG
ncbi:MAG: peptidase M61 [Gillisia sp.]